MAYINNFNNFGNGQIINEPKVNITNQIYRNRELKREQYQAAKAKETLYFQDVNRRRQERARNELTEVIERTEARNEYEREAARKAAEEKQRRLVTDKLRDAGVEEVDLPRMRINGNPVLVVNAEEVIDKLDLQITNKWDTDKITETDNYFIAEKHGENGFIYYIQIPKESTLESGISLVESGASNYYPDDMYSYLKNRNVENVKSDSIIIGIYKPNMANNGFEGFSLPEDERNKYTEEELKLKGYEGNPTIGYYLPIEKDIANRFEEVVEDLGMTQDNLTQVLGFSNGGFNALKTLVELKTRHDYAEPVNLVLCDEWRCGKNKDYIEENIDILKEDGTKIILFEDATQDINKNNLYSFYQQEGIPVIRISAGGSHSGKYKAAFDSNIVDLSIGGLDLNGINQTEKNLEIRSISVLSGYQPNGNINNNAIFIDINENELYNIFSNNNGDDNNIDIIQ